MGVRKYNNTENEIIHGLLVTRLIIRYKPIELIERKKNIVTNSENTPTIPKFERKPNMT